MKPNGINDYNDATWASLYAKSWDNDNAIVPSDDARTMASSVLGIQSYVGRYVHLIGETSIAYEHSENGNRFRDILIQSFKTHPVYPMIEGLKTEIQIQDHLARKRGTCIESVAKVYSQDHPFDFYMAFNIRMKTMHLECVC